jgi:PAS domain S-box-containing protein
MLAESSHDIFFALRFPEGRYEYISPSVERFFGFAPADFYRDPAMVLQCIAPAWRGQVQVWIAEMARGQVAEEYEFQVVDKRGGLRWMRQRQTLTPTGRGGWYVQGVASDVTELLAAQQALHDSSDFFRGLIEAWPDQVLLTVNLDAGRHEYVSPSMERVMGYRPQEFYDDPGLGMAVVAPQWQEEAWGWIAEIKQGVLRESYEFELVHKNGEHRWIHQKGALRPRGPGQDLMVQFTFRDITEQKLASRALMESESRYRELAEGWTHQALIRFNLRTSRFEYVSPGMKRLFGYEAEAFYLSPETLLERVAPEYRAVLALWRDETRRGELRPEYEYEIYDAAGERRWVLLRGSVINDASGQPVVLQAVLTDNTERRRLEDALKESNERYRLVSENLVDIIWAMDVEMRWTYLSPSAETLLGLPLQVQLETPITQRFSPQSLAAILQAREYWSRSPDRSEPLWLALDVYDAHHELVALEVLARPMRDAAGQLTGYCGTARDIRSRRRLERVEALLSRLAKGLLECKDLAQTQVLAAACAEDLSGALEVLAAHREPKSGRLVGPDGNPVPETGAEGVLSLPVLHAGEEVGRLIASGIAPENAGEAGVMLERVAALFALAVARIRAEGALRKSERMARMLLESMHEGVWAMDKRQQTIFANERLAAMLGYSVAELMRMRPEHVLDNAQRQVAMERIQERRLGIPGAADYDLLRKDGTRLPAHVSASPILDESGGFEGLVCTAVDLSERKQLEGELRRNQARFEALYELSRLSKATEAQIAGFTLREALRLTGSTAGALFFADAAGAKLLPLAWRGGPGAQPPPSFSTTGSTPWALVHAMRQPLVLNDFGLFAPQLPQEHLPVERFLGVPALEGDRPAAILGLTGKPGDYTPDDGMQVALLVDGMWRIVRGRRDEERIRASLREKEALLREVHHRVKNNLQVVSSLLDMAGRRLPEAEARRSMEEVRAKVQAMSLVHAQLHGEGARQQNGPGRGIDLERYVRALFRQLREIYSGGMELSLKVMLDELVLGLDQAAPLGLALNEILANVFKHARREGQPGRVHLRAWREDDGFVCIEVLDDGPGLPEGLVPERARSLGMKLMFGLVRNQLGGELTVESRPGGVCVHIRFRPHVAE